MAGGHGQPQVCHRVAERGGIGAGRPAVCGRRPAPGSTARTLGRGGGRGVAVPVDGERVMPACLLAVASVTPAFRAATRPTVAQPVSSDTMIRAAAAASDRRFNAIPSAARHSSAEGVGFEPTMSAETLADTLATALYATRTDDLLKTAPGNQDVTT